MNTHLNLLPWRAERRQRRWRSSLLALAVSVLVGGLVWRQLDVVTAARLHVQRQHQQALMQQLVELETQIATVERHAQHQRTQAIVRAWLERERLSLVHLLDALARHTPTGVVLSEVQQRGETLDLIARATSSIQIAQTVQQWGRLGTGSPALTSIKADSAGGYVFTLILPWPVPGAPVPVQMAAMEHGR